jgi:hypothetical protein
MELPFAEKVYKIAIRDFPTASNRHSASSWLTGVLPGLNNDLEAQTLSLPAATKKSLRAALAAFDSAMLPWDQLSEKIESVGPSTPWDLGLCAPGVYYPNIADEFRPTDWIWDAVRWVHFRHLWRAIEDRLTGRELELLVEWANQVLTKRGLPAAQIPTF